MTSLKTPIRYQQGKPLSSSKTPYRSKFEHRINQWLTASAVGFGYETVKVHYVWPAQNCTYHPDFILSNGVMVEAKGRLTAQDRQKMVLVKAQHPELDIRILFQRSKNPIYKNSKTTYADWATKNGFTFADGITLPKEWTLANAKRITPYQSGLALSQA